MLLVAAASRKLADAVLNILIECALLLFPRRTVPISRLKGRHNYCELTCAWTSRIALTTACGFSMGIMCPLSGITICLPRVQRWAS